MAAVVLGEMLYPEGHPYHWPVIGYMEDLTAASYEDVVAFFKKYYAPVNASLVVAGDIDPAKTRTLVEKWFGDVKAAAPPEPMTIPGVALTVVQKKTLTDRVQLPRLYLAWLTPRHFEPGDAALDVVADVLAGGKNSRLYKRLVYDMQIAQDVSAFQASQALSSSFQIIATPRPGHTVAELQKVIDEEIAEAAARGAHGPRARTVGQPDRGVLLRPDGAARRLRRQGRSAERVLHRNRRPRLVQRGSRPLSRAVGRRTSAPRPRRSCRSTGAWN